MVVEIPVKAKYRPTRVWSGYSRKHNGHGKREKKNHGYGNGYSDPYVREDHVLVLKDGRKRVWIHKNGTGQGVSQQGVPQ